MYVGNSFHPILMLSLHVCPPQPINPVLTHDVLEEIKILMQEQLQRKANQKLADEAMDEEQKRFVCTYVRTYVRMYVCMYMYVRIFTYVCKYVQSNLLNMKLLNMKYLLTRNTSQVQVQVQA